MVPLASRAGVLERGPAAEAWWLRAPRLLQEAEGRGAPGGGAAVYRFGDADLHLTADEPDVPETLRALYGDCAAAGRAPSGPRMRCTLRHDLEPPLALLTFQEGAPADAAGAAYGLLRPTGAGAPYGISESPVPGWRLAGGAAGPVLAARGPHVLVDRTWVPAPFLVEYLVGITLGIQPGLLPLHGASVDLGGRGLVLTGPSHAGKTTTALHLAAHGHALLGDEVAVLRLARGELVPFRRTVNLRPGPRTRELARALDRPGPGGRPARDLGREWVGPRRIGDLFPGGPAGPVPLRGVFFLHGFADQPSVERFRLTLDHEEVFACLVAPDITQCSWGLAPARRAFRLLALRQALAKIPCWRLRVGPPADTAGLIERTMEEVPC